MFPIGGAIAGVGNAIPGVMQNLMQQQNQAAELGSDLLLSQYFQSMVPGAGPSGASFNTGGMGQQQQQPSAAANPNTPQMPPVQQADNAAGTRTQQAAAAGPQRDDSKGGTMLPGGERFLDVPSTSQGKTQWLPALAQNGGSQPGDGTVGPTGAKPVKTQSFTEDQQGRAQDDTYRAAVAGAGGRGKMAQETGLEPSGSNQGGSAASSGPLGGGMGRMSFQDMQQRMMSLPAFQRMDPRLRGMAVMQAMKKLLPFMNADARLEAREQLAGYREEMARSRATITQLQLDRFAQDKEKWAQQVTWKERELAMKEVTNQLQSKELKDRIDAREDRIRELKAKGQWQAVAAEVAAIKNQILALTSAANAGIGDRSSMNTQLADAQRAMMLAQDRMMRSVDEAISRMPGPANSSGGDSYRETFPDRGAGESMLRSKMAVPFASPSGFPGYQ